MEYAVLLIRFIWYCYTQRASKVKWNLAFHADVFTVW